MAIVTLPVASFANALVRTEVDLNDVNLRVMVGRIINNSDYSALIEVYKAGILVASQKVEAHQTFARNLPSNIRFAMDTDIPPNMCMADIMIACKWPWSS